MTGRTRQLHPAERKYLLGAALGQTAQQTARTYQVSTNTVQTALARGKAALGAATIAQATALCVVLGEFSHDDVLRGVG